MGEVGMGALESAAEPDNQDGHVDEVLGRGYYDDHGIGAEAYGEAVIARILQMRCNGHTVLGEVRGEGAYMRWRDVCATCGTRSPYTVAIEFCIPENHWYCTSACHAVAAVHTRSTEPDNQDGHVRSRQARWACGQSRRPYYDDHGSSYGSDSRKA
jgi:hypothetical protein